ncbi:MAG: hypothetical protein JXB49_35865 [Bacteroidales bacterium]|nr:hypothetical protein [Bacteroidales bacterium]
MKIRIKTILFLLLTPVAIYGQCDNSLVEKAFLESGDNTIFVRDFKIQLKKGTPKKPAPVISFMVYLRQNIIYRFNVLSDENKEGEAIMQLYTNNELLGSTLNLYENIDDRSFDYYCDKSAVYRVLMSFKEGKEGCAVGILSIVIPDTIQLETEGRPDIQERIDMLFIGIDNPIDIYADVPDGLYDVSISEGEIRKVGKQYMARVYKEGLVSITVTISDSTGIVREETKVDFLALPLPQLHASVLGVSRGVLRKQDLMYVNKLDIDQPKAYEYTRFEVMEFTVSDRRNDTYGLRSNGASFTDQQRQYIQDLDDGSRFYITNILVKGPNDLIFQLEPLEFWLE